MSDISYPNEKYNNSVCMSHIPRENKYVYIFKLRIFLTRHSKTYQLALYLGEEARGLCI